MRNKQSGFTLIEFVVYVAVASVVLTVIYSINFSITSLRNKNQTIAEVEQQGQWIMNSITQSIRNARGVNSPVIGITASSLSLQDYTASLEPKIFNLASGNVTIKEGTATAIDLDSPKVVITNLSFVNLARTGTNSVIRISFVASLNNYSKNFISTAEVRGTQP